MRMNQSRREFLGLGLGFACTQAFGGLVERMDGRRAPLSHCIVEPWNEPFGKGRLYIAGGNYQGCLNEFRFT